MSARTLRVLAFLVPVIPAIATFGCFLAAIWLDNDRWASTGFLAAFLSVASGAASVVLVNAANSAEGERERIDRKVAEKLAAAAAERDREIARLEREAGIR